MRLLGHVKFYRWGAAAAILMSLAPTGGAAADADYLLADHCAGRVRITMTPDEAARQYPASRVKRWEPYSRVAVIDIDPAADPAGTPGLRLHLDRDQKAIWLIAVGGKRYKTAKGISTGSTFAELRQAYPQLILEKQEGEMDRLIVAQIPGEGISCVLAFDEDTWSKMKGSWGHGIPLSVVPDEKAVQAISIIPPR